MLYQFLDWRTGFHRTMCMFDVDRLLGRLREANGGQLPFCLTHWEHVQIFAGEASILLPENRNVAESLYATDAYPDLEWVRKQYETFIQWIGSQRAYQHLLVDPPAKPPTNPVQVNAVTTNNGVTEATFNSTVEGSVSNTEDKECLEQNPATASPGSTLTGSPNSLSMGKRRQPQPSPR